MLESALGDIHIRHREVMMERINNHFSEYPYTHTNTYTYLDIYILIQLQVHHPYIANV